MTLKRNRVWRFIIKPMLVWATINTVLLGSIGTAVYNDDMTLEKQRERGPIAQVTSGVCYWMIECSTATRM